MKIKVSAPGKLMLLGEHSVVYKHPCIVTAVDQRMFLSIEKIKEKKFILEAPQVNIANYQKKLKNILNGKIPEGAIYIETAIANFLKKFKIDSGFKVQTKSDFSSKLGFGSSSASAVCMIKALSIIFEKKLSKRDIFELAYKTHFDIRGLSSGFDVAAAIWGHTLYYSNLGKIIEPLQISYLPLIIGYTGEKASTSQLIEKVKNLKNIYPNIIKNIFENINLLVKKSKKAIIDTNWKRLGDFMNINQGFLESLGVNSMILNKLIYSCRKAGAYGAKLSGAGIGDCMIAIAPKSNFKKIYSAINKEGKSIEIKVNAPGVKIEN